MVPGWNESLPSIAALAGDLVESGELLGSAEARADVREVAESLWPRLGRCVPEVVELSADGS